jgi:hypothetical protein
MDIKYSNRNHNKAINILNLTEFTLEVVLHILKNIKN